MSTTVENMIAALGITKAKKRLKKELGITDAMMPFGWWTNTKRRIERDIGYGLRNRIG